jgi:ubiquinone/menaquinone biosynthesis C-methylase UbiE
MIPSCHVFDEFAGDYDQWFDEHSAVYEAQVRMLRHAVPHTGRGLEVGIGSGRFAVPLGIGYGIDPSRNLLKIAKSRGIEVMKGEGEHLPYHSGTFDYILMMTVICFADGVDALFREAGRVLVPGGAVIVGFIERGGEIEEHYRNEKTKGRFLRYARFWTADEVTRLLEEAGFTRVKVAQRSRGFCVIKGISKRSL